MLMIYDISLYYNRSPCILRCFMNERILIVDGFMKLKDKCFYSKFLFHAVLEFLLHSGLKKNEIIASIIKICQVMHATHASENIGGQFFLGNDNSGFKCRHSYLVLLFIFLRGK